MKVFYFTFEGIFSPVFDSQVLTPLAKIKDLEKSNCDISLLLFGSLRDFFNEKYKTRVNYIRSVLKKNCFFGARFPLLYKIPKLLKFTLSINSIICFIVLYFFFRLRKNERVVFHCRSHIAGYILLIVKKFFYKNASVYSDLRGISSIEVLYFYPNTTKNIINLSKRLKDIEKYVEENSDFLSCVSESFKKRILSNNEYKIANIHVVPCCVDTEIFKYDLLIRKEIRKQLELESNFVLLYSGSLYGWQLPKRMIEIFKIFKSYIKNSVFLLLTNDTKYGESLFSSLGVESNSYIVMSKSHNVLGKFLSAGDIGLIIREDNELNNISRPIKFSEYLRCGVPVLSCKSLYDVSNLVNNYKLGFELMDSFDDNEVERIVIKIKSELNVIRDDAYRRKISEFMKDTMGWDFYINSLIDIYKKCYNKACINNIKM